MGLNIVKFNHLSCLSFVAEKTHRREIQSKNNSVACECSNGFKIIGDLHSETICSGVWRKWQRKKRWKTNFQIMKCHSEHGTLVFLVISSVLNDNIYRFHFSRLLSFSPSFCLLFISRTKSDTPFARNSQSYH